MARTRDVFFPFGFTNFHIKMGDVFYTYSSCLSTIRLLVSSEFREILTFFSIVFIVHMWKPRYREVTRLANAMQVIYSRFHSKSDVRRERYNKTSKYTKFSVVPKKPAKIPYLKSATTLTIQSLFTAFKSHINSHLNIK